VYSFDVGYAPFFCVYVCVGVVIVCNMRSLCQYLGIFRFSPIKIGICLPLGKITAKIAFFYKIIW
jgi:hypothetical protein